MKQIDCPHCGHSNITKVSVSKDVVVVLPCPSCSEWIALFRDRVIRLDRRIIQAGSRDEKIAHISEIIVEFLDSGGLSAITFGDEVTGDHEQSVPTPPRKSPRTSKKVRGPITQTEMDRFKEFELDKIDESGYFRKHFG